MKKGLISLLLSVLLLNSCHLFPGFFLPFANDAIGIGANWELMGGSSVGGGVMLNFNGHRTPNWDFTVNGDGAVLVGEINDINALPFVYECKTGGSWQTLGGASVSGDSGDFYCISVAYSYDGTDYIPYCAYGINWTNTFHYSYLYSYDLASAYWPPYLLALNNHRFIDLIKQDAYSTDGPPFCSGDQSNIYAYSNKSATPMTMFYAQTIYFFKAVVDPINQYLGVISGVNYDMPVFQVTPDYSAIYSVGVPVLNDLISNVAGFEMVSSPGPIHALVTYMSNSSTIIIKQLESTTSTTLRAISGQGFSGIDTVYDHGEEVLYISVIENISNRGAVVLYRYNVATDALSIVGDPISSLNAGMVKLRQRPGMPGEFYVGVTDRDNQHKISIFRSQ